MHSFNGDIDNLLPHQNSALCSSPQLPYHGSVLDRKTINGVFPCLGSSVLVTYCPLSCWSKYISLPDALEIELRISMVCCLLLLVQNGMTALFIAAFGGHPAMVKLLLDAGGDPNMLAVGC